MQLPPIVFAIDILYKWVMVVRSGTILGAVALLMLHALLYKCCRFSAATSSQAILCILLTPVIILCQATPRLHLSGFPMQHFPPYKSHNGGIFQVFIVGQAVFWYLNYFYQGGQKNTFASPWLQADAIFSLLDGACHFYALVETFNSKVNIVILSCLLHDTCYSMFLNHSRHLVGWPSPLSILLVVSIGLRMVALAGMGVMMALEEHSLSSAFTILPAFFVLCAFVWPVSHTLGFYALLLCTINFSAAARFDPKMLNVYRLLLGWINRGRCYSKLQYLRRRLGTSKLLLKGRKGTSHMCAVWDTLTQARGSWAMGMFVSLSLWAAAVFSGWLYISIIVYYYWHAFSFLLWVSGCLILLTAVCVALGPYFSPVMSYAELSISAPFAEFSPPTYPLFPCAQGHRICEVMYKSPVLAVIQDYYHPKTTLSVVEYCLGKKFLVADLRLLIASFLTPEDTQLCLMQQMVIQSTDQLGLPESLSQCLLES
eukprot:EG_transcript_8703